MALCASQQLDLSMKYNLRAGKDWQTLKALLNLFYIFIRPTEKLQGSPYPTLNDAVIQ